MPAARFVRPRTRLTSQSHPFTPPDFLPFECDACHKVFCLDHRAYRTHDCPAAQGQEARAITCPLCAQTIRIEAGEDVNASWERHARTDCRPERRKAKKPRTCTVDGCRSKLTISNRVTCSKCHQEFCLAHRLESDHSCGAGRRPRHRAHAGKTPMSLGGGVAAQRAQELGEPRTTHGAAFLDALQRRQKTASKRGVPRRSPAPAPAPAPASAPASGRGASPRAPASAQPARPAAGAGADRCPQCGARFTDPVQLVAHVESAHSAGSGGGTVAQGAPPAARSQQQREVCPVCGTSFPNVQAMIAHAEREHTQTSLPSASRSGGGDDGGGCSMV